MKLKDKIYRKSPYFLKVLLLNIIGQLNKKQRYTKNFEQYLNEYKSLWKADLMDIDNYRNSALKKLLLESLNNSKWYHTIKIEKGITDEMIITNPFEVLKRMPILSKDDRKTKALLLENTTRKTISVGYTSGTSGSPTINMLDKESIERSFALWKRFHWFLGIKNNDRHIRLSGRILVAPEKNKPPFWVYNRPENQLLMSTYHMTEKNLESYISKIQKFKPVYIDGYPSAVHILAQYINKKKININLDLKGIAVTAETLYEHQRIDIKRAFGCPVFNQYASSEGSPFITECTHENLHINIDSGVFEILDENGNETQAGSIGRLVVTSFRNLKTPLIRYDIGDTVIKGENDRICGCGCKMPMVDQIIGREDDILWTEEKGYVGRMDTAYKGLEGINKGQILQPSPNSLVVNIEVDDTFKKTTIEEFTNNLKDRLGESIQIKINIVDNIPLGPNGKFIAVKRKFDLNG